MATNQNQIMEEKLRYALETRNLRRKIIHLSHDPSVKPQRVVIYLSIMDQDKIILQNPNHSLNSHELSTAQENKINDPTSLTLKLESAKRNLDDGYQEAEEEAKKKRKLQVNSSSSLKNTTTCKGNSSKKLQALRNKFCNPIKNVAGSSNKYISPNKEVAGPRKEDTVSLKDKQPAASEKISNQEKKVEISSLDAEQIALKLKAAKDRLHHNYGVVAAAKKGRMIKVLDPRQVLKAGMTF